MIGHIESYDDERQTGVIKNEEEFYEFHIDEWNLDEPPSVGGEVDFMPEDDGSATDISASNIYFKHMTPVKNRYVAGLLGLFPITGALGIHRIYLGFYLIAFMQVLLTVVTQGFGIVWPLIDGFLILSGNIKKDAKGRPLK